MRIVEVRFTPVAREQEPTSVNHLLTLPLALTANVVQPTQKWPAKASQRLRVHRVISFWYRSVTGSPIRDCVRDHSDPARAVRCSLPKADRCPPDDAGQ